MVSRAACGRKGEGRGSGVAALLADGVLHIAVVFVANVLLHLVAGGSEYGGLLDGPRFCVGARIVNGDFFFQVSQIDSPEAFDYMQAFGGG